MKLEKDNYTNLEYGRSKVGCTVSLLNTDSGLIVKFVSLVIINYYNVQCLIM